jgi:hypothetical protein
VGAKKDLSAKHSFFFLALLFDEKIKVGKYAYFAWADQITRPHIDEWEKRNSSMMTSILSSRPVVVITGCKEGCTKIKGEGSCRK